jgi:Cohesin domain/PEP-CTERM motif
MASWQAWKSSIGAALVLGALSAPVAAADPVVSFTTSPNPAVKGSPLGLDVLITGVVDLYAFQFTLSFNPTVLQATSVTEGAFLATGGTTFFSAGTINNTAGTVTFTADSLLGALPGVSGNGVLTRFNFSVPSVGTSPITFSNVLLLNSQLVEMAAVINNGVVTAVPEPAPFLLLAAGLAGLALRRRLQAA